MTKGGLSYSIGNVFKLSNRYTSLGSTYNTFPNPALLIPSSSLPTQVSKANDIPKIEAGSTWDSTLSPLARDDSTGICSEDNEMTQENDKQKSGKSKYRPAYELMDGSLERCGRGVRT